ncbi:MAG: UDP-N-acetylmuramoyl-tripeptide--D-alanyl-D-alanine ligase [Gammaproteobacteria bacterium]|nr:UDP-N-acetylmuramoyl-tripeptide--D-alanyl-D-alanine ligase [Gammaproteobacteria bacterium]
MRLSLIAQAIKAKQVEFTAESDIDISQVNTDTRFIEKGDLFVALKGPNFNGHDYLSDAYKKGCVAAIVDTFDERLLLPQLVVKDTRIALGLMAEAWRNQFNDLKVIGITGSCGKTTVKEMLFEILGEIAPTLATKGNFNNDIGVPLTLLRLNASHRFAVLELGANAMGEIAYTANMIHPDVAVITNAAAVHVEGFGGLANIVREKAEIYKSLTRQGCAVVNGDDANAPLWLDQIKESGAACLVSAEKAYSESGSIAADVWAQDVQQEELGGYRFDICSQSNRIPVYSSLAGFHNVSNALLVAAAAKCLNVPDQAIKTGLDKVKPAPGRLNIHTQNAFDVVLIDDTYNASPHSVKAAIKFLSSYPEEQLLILGDMGELGDEASKYHFEIGQYAKESGVHHLLATGRFSKSVIEGFDGQGVCFDKQEALIESLPQYLEAGMTVLVKGSRSTHMEKVCDKIRGSAV